jgi:hypothetical protein
MKLKPIDPTSYKKMIRYATMDIEAYDWIKFLCIGFYDGEKNHYEYFTNLNDYLYYSFVYCRQHKLKTIFGHFAGKYDFNFILEKLCFDNRFIIDAIIPRGASILCFDVKLKDDPDGFTLTYRDSSALLPFGLANLCDAFKVEVIKDTMDFMNMKHAWDNIDYTYKLKITLMDDPENPKRKIPRYKIETRQDGSIRYYDIKDKKWHEKIYNRNDILYYLQKDCISLWQVIQKFYEWPLVQQAGPSTTTASQAVKIWRLYIKEDIESIENKELDDFIRQDCYYGGRTEIFRPLFDANYDLEANEFKFKGKALKILQEQQGKKLYYLDVNSLYPTVMRSEIYPSKFSHWGYGKDAYEKAKDKIGFWEVLVEVPHDLLIPPLPLNHTFTKGIKKGSKKLIFPTGTFKGKWSTYELEYAKKFGVKIIEYYRGAIFNSGGYMFKEFIDDLYRIRLEAKANKDGVNDMNSKLIMNSCYGRLGLQTERSNLILDDGSIGLTLHSEIQGEDGTTVRFMEKPVTLEKAFTNVAISAMVTSYARVLMHKLMDQVGFDNIYYTDTDSIFIDKEWTSGKELGELKLEYTCTSACFLLPKTYVNEGIEGENFVKKLTMKGFDKKKIQHFDFEDFKHALHGDLRRLTVTQEPKFATLKTALRNNKFLMMNFDPQVKREIDDQKEQEYLKTTGKHKKFIKETYQFSERAIKSKYDKRIITNQGMLSKPIKLINNMEV